MADYTFICYAHENTRFALKLARALKQKGLAVWLDQGEAVPDEDWERIPTQALREAGHILLILSPEALNSWVVRDFTVLALNEGKPVILVLYRRCTIPATLQHLQPVDFAHKSFQEGLEQVYLRLAKESPRLEPQMRLPFLKQIRHRLAHFSLPPALGLAFILLMGLVVFLRWLIPEAQPRVLAEPVEPIVISQPILVPTVETLAMPNPRPTPISVKARSQDGQIMVFIPAGEFLMGALEDEPLAGEDEKPQRLIYLDDYWIDETEITNAQYRLCLEAGACSEPQAQTSPFRGDQFPIVGVNWEQARQYCEWVKARLPSEAEWEKAARGTDGRLYPWGNEFDASRLNYCDTNCIADWRDFNTDDGYRFTAPVGNYPAGASPYGVLDMSGNVWEWTADWYTPDSYQGSNYRNPHGPTEGLQRVIRGGSWYYHEKSARVTERHKDTPSSRYDNIGFRCAT